MNATNLVIWKIYHCRAQKQGCDEVNRARPTSHKSLQRNLGVFFNQAKQNHPKVDFGF